jgi:AmmeMemoRadiSam system protein A
MTEDLGRQDRRTLLAIARDAIAASLTGASHALPEVGSPLSEKRGGFVTLKERETGDLRGCIGYVEPLFPLVETVSRAAVAAALHDSRFPPVTGAELSGLAIEISVLSRPAPIRADAVVVGTHGLIVCLGGRTGLLLPQVATEYRWDAETFLDQTCRKAGLPAGAWRRPEAQVLAFTATVFGEDESG